MIVFADHRGKLEAEVWVDNDEDSSIMLSSTAPHPQPVHLVLSPPEARLLAAKLMDFADEQDAREVP